MPRGTPSGSWAPSPALRNAIPRAAYDVAIDYCMRLQRAGMPIETIEEAERLMIDGRYAKANKRKGRELSDDDWIMLVDATWDVIRETLSWKGVRV